MSYNFSLPFYGKDKFDYVKVDICSWKRWLISIICKSNTTPPPPPPPPKKNWHRRNFFLILLHFNLIYIIHENLIFYALLCYSGADILRLKYNPIEFISFMIYCKILIFFTVITFYIWLLIHKWVRYEVNLRVSKCTHLLFLPVVLIASKYKRYI